MTALVDVNGHALETGCYVEGHRGWHGHAHMISVATDLGFPLDVAGQRDVDAYDTAEYDDDGLAEIVFDVMNDAESWLNDHTASGYVWHWRDGEFFLSPLCENPDACTDETCAHWD